MRRFAVLGVLVSACTNFIGNPTWNDGGDIAFNPGSCGTSLFGCDPVRNAGCPSGQECVPVQSTSTGHLGGSCRVIATGLVPGAACALAGQQCVAGQVCTAGQCRDLCCIGTGGDQYCRMTTSNPQSTCSGSVGDQVAWCSLPSPCNWASQDDCSNGGTCIPRTDIPGVAECFPVGVISVHQPCTNPGSSVECVRGAACQQIGPGSSECVRVCNPNLPTSGCNTGEMCVAPPGAPYGACYQPCSTSVRCTGGLVCCGNGSTGYCVGACGAG